MYVLFATEEEQENVEDRQRKTERNWEKQSDRPDIS